MTQRSWRAPTIHRCSSKPSTNNLQQTFSTIMRSPTWMPLLLTFTVPEKQNKSKRRKFVIYSNTLKVCRLVLLYQVSFRHESILWVNWCPACQSSSPCRFERMLCGGGWAFFSHSTWNEQAKLFGGDHWPLNRAVTSWLCICKTLKCINIVMHLGSQDFTWVLWTLETTTKKW